MRVLPFLSLGLGIFFTALAWRRRRDFMTKPYFHWFLYFHLAAVGFHQFEEYGFPGGFRDAFVSVFGTPGAHSLVPPLLALEVANALGFTLLFAALGWLGTRYYWVGLALLFTNFGNGFFHLVHSVIHMTYVPGAVTGTLLYLPLALLATRHMILRGDIGGPEASPVLWTRNGRQFRSLLPRVANAQNYVIFAFPEAPVLTSDPALDDN